MLRFLADVNVEKRIVDYLFKNEYDVKWVPDFDCTIEDKVLLKIANEEKRILITNDKDFGELTFLQRQASIGNILIRVNPPDTKEKIELLQNLLLNYSEKIQDHFILITKNKYKFVPLENIE